MRIGITFFAKDDNLSGVEYYTLGLIRSLTQYCSRHKYVVFTNRPEIVSQSVNDRSRLTLRQVGSASWRPLRILWEHGLLPRMAERERLNVLHCPCYICPVLPCRVPYVVTVHDTIAMDHAQWCTRLNACYYRLVMKSALKQAAGIVAVSRYTQTSLQRHLTCDAKKIQVIYPGIDPDFGMQQSKGAVEAVRARYGLPERYILYVGNIEPKKNVEVLLDAYELIRRTNLPHHLVLVGRRSWKAKSALDRISGRKAIPSLMTPGYVRREDLPAVYQMADLYVCTSLCEGFGFPPLEAMASGVPVASSQAGALAETVADAAFSIDPASCKNTADAIVTLLSDSNIRKDYMARGLAQSTLFDWKRAARQLLELYEQVAV